MRTTCAAPCSRPRTPGYDEARALYNAAIDRRPALIARCSGTADVVDAVNFARQHSLLTAVRAGGHSVAGHSMCDDGFVIDLSQMRGVWVDADTSVVRVQGGATWGDVDRETQRVGLAVPGGVVSTTGVAGLTLGGGLGWLHRKYGLACDNVRSVEIVTADGGVLRADASEHDDLFWALRGGGGNFGVVTSFEFDAHLIGPVVMLAAVAYPLDAAADILPAWRDWTESIPDEVTSRAVMFAPPVHPALPPELHDRDVAVVAAVYAGPVDDGDADHGTHPPSGQAGHRSQRAHSVPGRAVDVRPFRPRNHLGILEVACISTASTAKRSTLSCDAPTSDPRPSR